jgi:hypothetical protein
VCQISARRVTSPWRFSTVDETIRVASQSASPTARSGGASARHDLDVVTGHFTEAGAFVNLQPDRLFKDQVAIDAHVPTDLDLDRLAVFRGMKSEKSSNAFPRPRAVRL